MYTTCDILVIGDIILDKYVFGEMSRISPEAPCPVFLEDDLVTYQLGGAANVANQLSHLGYKVSIYGLLSQDSYGEKCNELFQHNNIDASLVSWDGAKTTLKTRFISNKYQQQLFRVDQECYCKNEGQTIIDLLHNFDTSQKKPLCIVLSDDDKGVINNKFCQEVIKYASKINIPTVVDIKTRDIERYKSATIIKGNLKEISALSKAIVDISDSQKLLQVLCELKDRLKCEYLVTTCGSEGIVAVDSCDKLVRINAQTQRLKDVTGAGDIVTAYLAANLIENVPLDESLKIANKAASISISRVGTTVVSQSEVSNTSKLITDSDLNIIRENRKIVFTNGCFDVIHAGHVDLLEKAKSLGDILVVGLNSDSSIKEIKGENRPINGLSSRIKVLSSISAVDYIMVFDETTPLNLIKNINPNVLVKGSDYKMSDIVGADYVLSKGGQVKTIPFEFDSSTSQILQRI